MALKRYYDLQQSGKKHSIKLILQQTEIKFNSFNKKLLNTCTFNSERLK